jgi:hypothetical protein
MGVGPANIAVRRPVLSSSIVAMPPGIRVSSTTTKTVDCPNLTFSDNQRTIAHWGRISP